MEIQDRPQVVLGVVERKPRCALCVAAEVSGQWGRWSKSSPPDVAGLMVQKGVTHVHNVFVVELVQQLPKKGQQFIREKKIKK